jgi:hypothetical protein
MTSVVSADRDVQTESVNESKGKEHGLHEIMGSMIHNKPKSSLSMQIVPEGIAFIIFYVLLPLQLRYLQIMLTPEMIFTLLNISKKFHLHQDRKR